MGLKRSGGDKFETHSYSESQVCQPKLFQTYYTKYDI